MPWYRDRIPAILKVIKGSSYNIKLNDIHRFLFKNKKNYLTNKNILKDYLTKCDLEGTNNNFKKKILKIKPKILVLGTADNYHHFLIPETIKYLRSNGIFVTGILGDDEFNYKRYRFLIGWFDLYVVYVKTCLKYYEKFKLTKGYYLPNSCFLDNNIYGSNKNQIEFDVILIGSPFGNRPSIIKSLIDENIKVGIFGSNKWKNYSFARSHYHGYVPSEKFDQILSKGKIILALLENHIDGKLHMNTKIWEAVRVGRLPISTYYKPLFRDYGLKEGKTIVTYKSTKELVKKVKYYSAHNHKREMIAENLYNEVKLKFDYSVLYEVFFDYVVKYSKKKNFYSRKNLLKEYPRLNKTLNDLKLSHIKVDEDEIKNHLQILSKTELSNKVNFILYNSLENKKKIIYRWPFLNLKNLLLINSFDNKILNFIFILKSVIKKEFVHIKQICLIKKKLSFMGYLNLLIEKILNTPVGNIYRKYLKF